MSSFPGLFSSIPGISCDNFTGQNEHSDQFFLSHCHADHMRGLDTLVLLLRRKNSVRVNHRIYCSFITKSFLLGKYRNLDDRFIRVLEVDTPMKIDVYDKKDSSMYKCRVTGISAGHCPGSFMFSFERLDDNDEVVKRILYTGDFRLENVELSSITSLHDPNNFPIKFDEMYLDTTFCTPEYSTFPTRDEAIQTIWELVNSWIRKNGMYRNHRAKHVILFHLPAQYGSEAILKAIYEKSGYKWKIHVSKSKYLDYLCAQDLGDCTSSDPKKAQWIHACSWREENDNATKSKGYFDREIPCQNGPFEVCQIRPSAMYFRKDRLPTTGGNNKFVKCVGGQSYRICYSTHASGQEVLKFVQYFRPVRVIPCVDPPNSSKFQVSEFLTSALESSAQSPRLSSSSYQIQEDKSFGDYYPPEATPSVSSDSVSLFETNWKDSPTSDGRRKRKSKTEVLSGGNKRKRSFVDFSSSSSENDDDIEEQDDDCAFMETGVGGAAAKSKRKVFQKSRSMAYSMPILPDTDEGGGGEGINENGEKKSRRASLPHSLKIPAITITPSSPSPDPNHPDYPEFFQDKYYIESSRNMSTDSSTVKEDFLIEDAEMKSPTPSPTTLSSTQSTPEFKVIVAQSTNSTEKLNCLNFAKKKSLTRTKKSLDFS